MSEFTDTFYKHNYGVCSNYTKYEQVIAVHHSTLRELIPEQRYAGDTTNVQSAAFADGWNQCRLAMLATVDNYEAEPPRTIKCQNCEGTGESVPSIIENFKTVKLGVPCPECNGTGKLREITNEIACPNCQGSGQSVTTRVIGTKLVQTGEKCQECNGTGKLRIQ